MKKLILAIALTVLFTGCARDIFESNTNASEVLSNETIYTYVTTDSIADKSNRTNFDLSDIPEFDGSPYYIVNNNNPFFVPSEITSQSYEFYSKLDSLGRCGYTMACIGPDILPTEERGEIGMIKPTGWHTIKYDNVDGKYLYNRCHLIGYQLTGENANECNLITGTRYMNVEGMLPFENLVAAYVKNTENHVMYRVTPYYNGDDLVAKGVLMEAISVEDSEVCFNVFCYNNQPGIKIDYSTGDSWPENEYVETTGSSHNAEEKTYILNKNSKKFHTENCDSVAKMKPQNKKVYTGDRDDIIQQGYDPCGICNP